MPDKKFSAEEGMSPMQEVSLDDLDQITGSGIPLHGNWDNEKKRIDDKIKDAARRIS
tara:strand:- start:1116 stop:1286 length:171 start_codon:yes stop_codon:yes gene_type:complete